VSIKIIFLNAISYLFVKFSNQSNSLPIVEVTAKDRNTAIRVPLISSTASA